MKEYPENYKGAKAGESTHEEWIYCNPTPDKYRLEKIKVITK